ncbi:hypothetical protein HYFRA_00013989 [Hymenoscyphus fraxineus]|uniref:Uncharacterized protein n=1 Tax=Hymenoscyphus fraxineus TaxID=746836 RepID=A0A9N9LC73_9HELO|nr:hypothetical protein HYFRA_00013989 [Hymenoscyphus fraxineus]
MQLSAILIAVAPFIAVVSAAAETFCGASFNLPTNAKVKCANGLKAQCCDFSGGTAFPNKKTCSGLPRDANSNIFSCGPAESKGTAACCP